MLQDLKKYKLLLDAIKFSIYNNNVENDMKDNYTNTIYKELLCDNDIKKMILRNDNNER